MATAADHTGSVASNGKHAGASGIADDKKTAGTKNRNAILIKERVRKGIQAGIYECIGV